MTTIGLRSTGDQSITLSSSMLMMLTMNVPEAKADSRLVQCWNSKVATHTIGYSRILWSFHRQFSVALSIPLLTFLVPGTSSLLLSPQAFASGTFLVSTEGLSVMDWSHVLIKPVIDHSVELLHCGDVTWWLLWLVIGFIFDYHYLTSKHEQTLCPIHF
jgi:hypothetical protein